MGANSRLSNNAMKFGEEIRADSNVRVSADSS